jgi:hypothetical protein
MRQRRSRLVMDGETTGVRHADIKAVSQGDRGAAGHGGGAHWSRRPDAEEESVRAWDRAA